MHVLVTVRNNRRWWNGQVPCRGPGLGFALAPPLTGCATLSKFLRGASGSSIERKMTVPTLQGCYED